jgi:hypothetical protein
MKAAVNLEGAIYGKFNQRASAASCWAQSGTVARGEVGSSDFRDRVVKRIGNIPDRKPTEANNIGSFTTENGASAKGEMGEDSKGIAASSGGSQNDWFGSCKAHDVGVSPEEDRSGTAGEMGEVQSSEEEGGLEPAERLWLATTEPITRIVLHSYSSEE